MYNRRHYRIETPTDTEIETTTPIKISDTPIPDVDTAVEESIEYLVSTNYLRQDILIHGKIEIITHFNSRRSSTNDQFRERKERAIFKPLPNKDYGLTSNRNYCIWC